MKRLPILFLIGFVLTYLPLVFVFSKIQSEIPQVQAYNSDESKMVVVLETLAPEEKQEAVLAAADEEVTATPETTESPTPKPTAKPSPTESPTPVATETPSPTPEPTETPAPEPTATPDVWAPAEYDSLIAQYAGQYGVDRNILDRLAVCESHFNPNSQNGDYLGIFQFSKGTWQNYRSQMGMDPNPDLRSNAEESIRTAAYVVQQRGTAPWPSCI